MRRRLKWIAVVALLCGSGFLGWLAWFAVTPIELAAAPVDVGIESGSSLRAVSRQLADAGIRFWPWQFTLLARLKGNAADIKAGSYEIEAGLTPLELLRKLTRGDVSQGELALIDGWNFKQVRTALDQYPNLRHDSQGLSEAQVLERIGAVEHSAEGLFFPDTYLFDKNASDLEVLKRAYRAMHAHLDAEWSRRDAAVPYANPYEALIVASLVEKETGVAADRALIAAVFANRLRNGMPLQTDPSVIYGMGAAFDGNLRKADLLRDTAYNTYTRVGLPPTPIAMPGLASIHATLRPAVSDHLYFVARGDGSSEFSRTLDEHNRAVSRYQKRRAN